MPKAPKFTNEQILEALVTCHTVRAAADHVAASLVNFDKASRNPKEGETIAKNYYNVLTMHCICGIL